MKAHSVGGGLAFIIWAMCAMSAEMTGFTATMVTKYTAAAFQLYVHNIYPTISYKLKPT